MQSQWLEDKHGEEDIKNNQANSSCDIYVYLVQNKSVGVNENYMIMYAQSWLMLYMLYTRRCVTMFGNWKLRHFRIKTLREVNAVLKPS